MFINNRFKHYFSMLRYLKTVSTVPDQRFPTVADKRSTPSAAHSRVGHAAHRGSAHIQRHRTQDGYKGSSGQIYHHQIYDATTTAVQSRRGSSF